MKLIIRVILNHLWNEYSKDKSVIYARKPVGRSILSAEGFLLWLRGKHPEG